MKLSFIYGLVSGLALLGLAGAAFLGMRRMKGMGQVPSQPVAPESHRDTQVEFDRLVAAVLDEQKRRAKKALKADAPVHKPKVAAPAPV